MMTVQAVLDEPALPMFDRAAAGGISVSPVARNSERRRVTVEPRTCEDSERP